MAQLRYSGHWSSQVVKSLACIPEVLVRMSPDTRSIITEDFRDFPQFTQPSVGRVPLD